MKKQLYQVSLGKSSRLFRIVICIATFFSSASFIWAQNDAGVASVNDLPYLCPGSHPVTAVVENFGAASIDTVTVNWSVDGVIQPVVSYYSTIGAAGSGSSTASVTLGNYTFAGNQNYNLKVWTSLPGNNTDVQNLNDTAVAVLAIANQPEGISVSDITTTSVIISADPAHSPAYSLIYGPQGFDVDTGGTSVTGISSMPYQLTGLSSGTKYDLYIYAECGGSGVSDTTGPVPFRTNCPVQFLPFLENFDTGLGCFEAIDGGTSTNTWINAPGTGTPFFPGTSVDGTPHAITEMDPNTLGIGTAYHEILLSPVIDASDVTFGYLLMLEFDHMLLGFEMGADSVSVDVYDGNQWQTVYSIKDMLVGVASGADHQMINIAQYANDSLQIRFVYGKSPMEIGAWFVDNISLVKLFCLQPLSVDLDSITHESVDIRLDSSISNLVYEIDTIDFEQGTGRMSGTMANFGTLSGLDLDTQYDIYVRSDCDTNGLSNWVGPFSFKTRCAPSEQLSGNYTIDPGQPTGGTNFNSFTEASLQLRSCGIKGPVIFDIMPGTYNDSLVLTDIVGTDAVNTIVFRGDKPENTILTSASSIPVVYLNGADHITIKNITIANTRNSVDTWGIFLRNSANYNSIDSCHIEMPVTSTLDVVGIASSNVLSTKQASGENASYLTISNCTITGGEAGIFMTGKFGEPNPGHIIKNNILRHQNNRAINLLYTKDVWINNNEIDSLTLSKPNGINIDQAENYVISGNKINGGGLFVSRGYGKMMNNMIISKSNHYAISVSNSDETSIFHNSVAGSPAIRLDDHLQVDIRNNVLYSPAGYTVESVNTLDSADMVDHNLYHINSSGSYSIGGVVYADLQEWQTADITRNISSVEGDPLFIDPSADLHVYGLLADSRADSSTGVDVDIDGDIRSSSTPDIGADEYNVDEDICFEIERIVITGQHFDDGTGDFTFSFDRDGDDYELEIGPCGFEQGTGTITSGMGPVTVSGLNPNTCYDLFVRRICDSSQTSSWAGPFSFVTKCPETLQLAGTYSIDPGQPESPTNFISFGSALDALNCGVSGPVVFEVASGTYNENIILEEVFGASPENTITFRGTDSSNTKLTYSSFDDMPTVYLNGADFIILRNMTISNTNSSATSSWGVVHLRNQAEHNIVDSCRIEVPQNTLMHGVVVSNSLTSPNAYGNNSNNLTISNCAIIGGESAIYLNGDNTRNTINGNHTIENNTLRDQNLYGIISRYIDDIHISGNDIDRVKSHGIYMYHSQNYEIQKNKVIAGAYGLYFWSSFGNTLDRCRIINNMIISKTSYGMYLSDNTSKDIFHNSVSGFPAVNVIINGTDIDIRNNIFHSKSISSTTSHPAVVAGSVINGVVDYNLYYSNHHYLFDIDQNFYNDLNAWQLVNPGQNANSLEDDPLFTDYLNDLHIIYSLGHGKGDPSAEVTEDIDGETRSATAPTIGADEFDLPSCVPSHALKTVNIYPDSIRLAWNAGSGNTYNIWHGPPGFMQDPSVSGTKVTGITSTPYTLTGLTPQTAYDIYVSDYCGNGDTSVWYSHVATQTLCTGQLSGRYTIDNSQVSSSTNFSSFSEAFRYLQNCGISGPVTFDVLPGTYEGGDLAEIPGADSMNTIVFRGSDPVNTIVKPSPSQAHVFYLNGTDHITFRNMTIKNEGSANSARGILLQNEADFNHIDSCHIAMPSGLGTAVSTYINVASSGGFNNKASYLTVSHCRIRGGASGIVLNGNDGDSANVGHVINHNAFRHQNDYSIYTRYVQDVKIFNNDIDSTTSGMHIFDTDDYHIFANRIKVTDYGLYINRGNQDAALTARSRIENNMIISRNSYGAYLLSFKETDIFHNSIVGKQAIRTDNQVNMNIRNNILYGKNDYAFVAVDPLGSNDVVDHNLYYSDTNISRVGGVSYSDLSVWQIADVLRNGNSIEGDPDFISFQDDLHIKYTSIAIDEGDTSIAVDTDINGQNRPAPDSQGVDIGADEFYFACDFSENLAIDSIACTSVVLTWNPGMAGNFSIIEYDTAGFIAGSGEMIFSSGPLTIPDLDTGTAYEAYLYDTCGTDTFAVAGPVSFTTPSGKVRAAYNFVISPATFTDQTVNFNAIPSIHTHTYKWDLGDGNTALGDSVSHSYTTDGSYEVQLIVTGECDSDTLTQMVEIEGISIEESILEQSLMVYPNPAIDKVNIHFKTQNSGEIIISLTDLSGKMIMQKAVSDSNGKYEGVLYTGHLAKGTYILQIQNREINAIRRIIRE